MEHRPTTSGISESCAWVICACGEPSVVQRYEYADSGNCLRAAAERLFEHIAEKNDVPVSKASVVEGGENDG